MTEVNDMTFNVSRIYEDRWAVEFDDGVTLHIAKGRDESHIDALIEHHAANGDDKEHTARIRAMVRAVREYEAALMTGKREAECPPPTN